MRLHHARTIAELARTVTLSSPLAVIAKSGVCLNLSGGSAGATFVENDSAVRSLARWVGAAFVRRNAYRKTVFSPTRESLVLMFLRHVMSVPDLAGSLQSGISLMEVLA